MSNINESDDFAAKAMEYLEKRGFKVTKDKFDLPVVTNAKHNLSPSEYYVRRDMIKEIAENEIRHIRDAFIEGQEGRYKNVDEFMKHKYNDITLDEFMKHEYNDITP